MSENPNIKKVLGKNRRIMKGTMVDASGYVINRDVKLPSWVKCCVCGKPPTAMDWLKPVNSDPNCKRLVHLSHIPNGPKLSEEAGYIARNA